jgi:hypothetical protein
LTSLTAIFGSSTEKPEENEMESEKLLNLYWNRAELKKEFAELRSEKFQLQERVKEHEGATARVQQKLEQLENLLLDPAWVYNIVTHFQLQGLNLKCQAQVAKFAEQLKRQREQRLHSQLVDDWNGRRSEEAVAIEKQIGEQRLQAQMLEDRLQAERHRLANMSGFTRLFRGRSLTASLDRIAASIHAAQRNESVLFGELAEIQDRDPPDTQGLDTATKRMINFMILAFSQQQFLALRENEIASLAKESGDKSVGAINYGGKESCEEILAHITDRLDALSTSTDFAGELQTRAKLIAENARFRDPNDAVPTAESVSIIYEFGSDGAVKESKLNLLGENYWNVSNVVSR